MGGDWESKERTVTVVKTGRGERNLPLTISLTFWWATGTSDDQQDRDRETATEREISVVPLWADLELIYLVTATND